MAETTKLFAKILYVLLPSSEGGILKQALLERKTPVLKAKTRGFTILYVSC